jgi:hypothetical protein
MPWGYAIAAGGALGSALISSGATNDAADATGAAAKTATAESARQFNIGQANQQPWLTTGSSALSQLAKIYGLDSYSLPPPGSATGANGTSGGNPSPGMIAAQAAGPHSKNGVTDGIGGFALDGGLGLFRKNASPIQDIAAAMANGTPITDSQWAQAGYAPGGSAPGSQPGSATGVPGASAGTFTPGSAQPGIDPNASFYQSPDYQFRLSQGIKGADAGAAARGLLDSGATRKAEITYAGNLASGEFNDYANRLQALAGVGQTTATNTANQGQTYATQVGNVATTQGQNMASSYTANGATYAGAVRDLAGVGTGYLNNQSTYNPTSGGLYNGRYYAPFNSADAAQGF